MLTLYLRSPFVGNVLAKHLAPNERVDFFTCLPLAVDQVPPNDDLVASIHEATIDREERAIPEAILRKYDLVSGLNTALRVPQL